MRKKIYLSLIIPLYNEEKRFSKSFKLIDQYLRKQKYSWEVIFVDDGSTDATLKLLEKTNQTNSPYQIIHLPKNQGKGAAIRKGMLEAKGKYVVFSDIDLSTPLTMLPKLFKQLNEFDLAIGVRRHPKSEVTKHQSILREFLGQCFTLLTKTLIDKNICDATCGFKGFKSNAANQIFQKTFVNRWAFDAEIIFLAKKYQYSITQVPVVWQNNSDTKVQMWQDGIRAFWDLIKIRLWDLVGNYN